jgi:hypothetical protein
VVLGGGNGVVVARGCSRGKRFQNLSQPMNRRPFVLTGQPECKLSICRFTGTFKMVALGLHFGTKIVHLLLELLE